MDPADGDTHVSTINTMSRHIHGARAPVLPAPCPLWRFFPVARRTHPALTGAEPPPPSPHPTVGACFPYMQPVPGWLQLQVLLQLHGDQPFARLSRLEVQWLTPWGSWQTAQAVAPVAIPGCYLPLSHTSACNTTVTVNVDTAQFVEKDGRTPVDGVVSLRVQAVSPQADGCPAIFNSTLSAPAFNSTLNATVQVPRQVVVFDPECTARTAGFEAPVIVNNGGTWDGRIPPVPPRLRGLSFLSQPWAATTMETNGWIPGYAPPSGGGGGGDGRGRGARQYVVTDATKLVLPGYGAGCVSPVGISVRQGQEGGVAVAAAAEDRFSYQPLLPPSGPPRAHGRGVHPAAGHIRALAPCPRDAQKSALQGALPADYNVVPSVA